MWVIKINSGNHLKFNGGYLEGVALTTSDLTDFSIDQPNLAQGQLLSWDGNDWVNSTITSDNLIANLNAVNYSAVNTDSITDHLSAIDDELALTGSLIHSRQSASFNASVGVHYSIDTTAGAVVVTLPLLSAVSAGDRIRVYLRARPGTNDVTISRNGGGADTINGSATFTLDVQYDTITLVANPTDNLWEVV